jgi:phosphate transport system substrate-binding protein
MMNKRFLNTRNTLLAVVLFAALGFNACSGNSGNNGNGGDNEAAMNDENALLGAGSTFVYPLFSKQFSEYHKTTGLKVNYQSIGSGGGILQLTNKTVDFGDSDTPLNKEQTEKIGADILHIPMCSGAVVLSYNLPELKGKLNLTPALLADLFLGKILSWKDARIVAANPGVNIPDMAVVIAHRSDGSGTTNIFTTYLSKVSPEWTAKVGAGSAINWLTGLGGKGNEGIAGLIKQTPGSIGYIELAFAMQNKMPFASIQNKAGKFIAPSVASTSAASNINLPADAKISLSNTEAADGYPISGFTWAIVYKEQNYSKRSAAKSEQLIKLLWWNIHEGQKYCEALHYAPLSAAAVVVAEKILKSATYSGKPILK